MIGLYGRRVFEEVFPHRSQCENLNARFERVYTWIFGSAGDWREAEGEEGEAGGGARGWCGGVVVEGWGGGWEEVAEREALGENK